MHNKHYKHIIMPIPKKFIAILYHVQFKLFQKLVTLPMKVILYLLINTEHVHTML